MNFVRWMVGCVVLIIGGAPAAVHGADYYWSANDPFDGYSWSVAGNWSTTRPFESPAGVVPGAGDVVYWALETPVDKNIVLGTDREIAGWVTDTTTTQYPFVNNFGGIVENLKLTGTPYTIPDVGFNEPGVVMYNSVNITFANLVNIELTNAAPNIVYVGGGQTKFEGSVVESAAGADLTKYGYAGLVVQGSWGLTGDINLVQGELNISQGFSANSLTIANDVLGEYKVFSLNNGQNYSFQSVTVEGVSLANGVYGYADFVALGHGADFTSGTGTITVGAVAPTLPGDYNDDNVVNAADYTVWRDNQGSNVDLPNDDNLTGPIGAAHYSLWRANFGDTGGSLGTAASAVPTPGSGLLLVLGSLTGIAFKRRWN